LARAAATAYAFVSPSRTPHESIADAQSELPASHALTEHARYLPGVQKATPALGVWNGGAEPAAVIHGDPSSIAGIAEGLGGRYGRGAGINFTPGQGPDALPRFKSNDSPEKIHADLSALGIENKTIVPGGATYVVDMNDEN